MTLGQNNVSMNEERRKRIALSHTFKLALAVCHIKFTWLSDYKPNLPNSFISRRSHFFIISLFHPFTLSPFHLFTLSPFHSFTLSPLYAFSSYQTASASLISPSPFLSFFADFTSICPFLCILNKRFALISR